MTGTRATIGREELVSGYPESGFDRLTGFRGLATRAVQDRYNIQMKLLWYPNFQDAGMRATKWSILHRVKDAEMGGKDAIFRGSASRDMGLLGIGSRRLPCKWRLCVVTSPVGAGSNTMVALRMTGCSRLRLWMKVHT